MDKDKALTVRHLFMRVFGSEDGKLVLANILNNLGYFETDERLIKPEYIAFANRLLHDCGINIPQNWHFLMDKMFETSGDKDIKEI